MVSRAMSLEDCLRFCKVTSTCLGVSVGRVSAGKEGQCWQITELPDDGWDTPDDHDGYNTWRKGNDVSQRSTNHLRYVLVEQ